ncbi:hypothetical protein P879_08403 [Paragonimus westermani]|uniref:C2H2-type domain-containing protein n=1 Tax=Paragonimus westermani TaxID=34504 RepID=A0A8T0D9I7_9TREM|nr:hypothetical protein P879_08403 [Paragonimus westermani]
MFASDLGELFNNAGSSASDVSGHFTIPNNLSVTSANLDFLRGIGASHSGPGRFAVSSIPQSVSRSVISKPPVMASTNVDRQQQQQQFFHSDGRLHSDTVSDLIPSSDPLQVSHKLDSAQPQQQNEDFTSTLNHTDNATTKSATKLPTSGHHRGTLRCPFCDKAFSNSSAIAKHKLTHSDERKYVCSICHKAFKRQDHLNGHKYTHETKKPHACHFCDKSYSDARSLRRHYENAHPEEYDRWLMLSQATNGDTSAFAVAAAALLSSTSLDSDAAGSSGSGNSIQANAAPVSSSSILNALSNPMCKLLASNLTRASAYRMDSSPMSSHTVDSHGNDAAVNGIGLIDRRSAHKHKPHRSTDWTLSCSPRSSNSGCSLSNATSPSGTLDTLEREDDAEDKSAATLASLSSLTATDMAAAAKVALMMAHPLEAPKRVACAVCQKRFKNQSALNGHMRLHGGYGPAGLTAISTTTTAATTNSPAQSRDVPAHSESVSASSSHTAGFASSVATGNAKSHETNPEPNMLEDLLDPLIAAVTKSVMESTGSIADSSTMHVSGAATWPSDASLTCRLPHSSAGVSVISSQENFLSFPTPPPPPYHPSHRIKTHLGTANQEDARVRSEHSWFQGATNGDESWLSSSIARVPTSSSSQSGKACEATSTVTSSSRSSWWTSTDSGHLKTHLNRVSLNTHSNEFTSELRASRIDVYPSSNVSLKSSLDDDAIRLFLVDSRVSNELSTEGMLIFGFIVDFPRLLDHHQQQYGTSFNFE